MPRSKFAIVFHLLALMSGLAFLGIPTMAQEQALYGGTMVVATFADPGSLNPEHTTSVPTHVVTGPIVNGPIAHDFAFTPVRIWPGVGRFPLTAGPIPSSSRNRPRGTMASQLPPPT